MKKIVFNLNYKLIEHKLYYMLGFLYVSDFKIMYSCKINSDEKLLILELGENSGHYENLLKIIFSEYIQEDEIIKDNIN